MISTNSKSLSNQATKTTRKRKRREIRRKRNNSSRTLNSSTEINKTCDTIPLYAIRWTKVCKLYITISWPLMSHVFCVAMKTRIARKMKVSLTTRSAAITRCISAKYSSIGTWSFRSLAGVTSARCGLPKTSSITLSLRWKYRGPLPTIWRRLLTR